MSELDVIPMDPICPRCDGKHGVEVSGDGYEWDCEVCGGHLMCAIGPDGGEMFEITRVRLALATARAVVAVPRERGRAREPARGDARMRALTLTQPWAGLVASGIKLIENRPRRMIKAEDFGERFAIHASREIDELVYKRIAEMAPDVLPDFGKTVTPEPPWFRLSRITSAVIGVATIDRVVTGDRVVARAVCEADGRAAELGDQLRWFFGPIGYVLRDVIALETPVPCRGFQGFWTLPADVAVKVGEQICDECDGSGAYLIDGKPVACICSEAQA